MARLASIEKRFLSHPAEETDLICSRLTAEPGQRLRSLTCCGEDRFRENGKLSKSTGVDVVSYGVELEEGEQRSTQSP